MRYIKLVLFFLIAFTSMGNAGEISYQRGAAEGYFGEYCRKYNYEKYVCYDGNDEQGQCIKAGSNCANFDSQVLIAGGIDFNSSINTVEIGKNNGVRGVFQRPRCRLGSGGDLDAFGRWRP